MFLMQLVLSGSKEVQSVLLCDLCVLNKLNSLVSGSWGPDFVFMFSLWSTIHTNLNRMSHPTALSKVFTARLH